MLRNKKTKTPDQRPVRGRGSTTALKDHLQLAQVWNASSLACLPWPTVRNRVPHLSQRCLSAIVVGLVTPRAKRSVRTVNSDLHFGHAMATAAGADAGSSFLIKSNAPPLVFTSA